MRHFFFLFLFLFSLACFSQDTIHVKLFPNDTLNPIASDFAGLSFEKNCLNKGYFGPSDSTLVQLFTTCGIKSMRVGADAVDTDQLSTVADEHHFTTGELDDLFQFAHSAGCRIFLGLNLRDSNYFLAKTEANYVMQHYPGELLGFEVGNEPDLYNEHGYRKPAPYTVIQYEQEFKRYYDTIRKYQPMAVFTGPGCAAHHTEWTEPFCRDMGTIPSKISMLTHHYYGGKGEKHATQELINLKTDTLLMKNRLDYISRVADSLVKYAKRSHIPFRMSETNSLDDGGMWGVSNAFVSALWALDYMYRLAYDSCAGVNFHGGLEGRYTVFSKYNGIYRAHPIAYGILAFQAGSKGTFIKDSVSDNILNLNLNSYSVIDKSKIIYTTIINKEKDSLKQGLISLEVETRNGYYVRAEYLQLSSDSLGDTTRVTLGGQVVDSLGRIPAYTWTSLPVTAHKTHLTVPPASAVVVKFIYRMGNSVNDHSGKNKNLLNLYPNPASDKVTVLTDITGHSVISVYSLQGQLLLQQQIQQGKTDIDISTLAKGVYIVRLTGNAGSEAGKIIKE
jgi:hypothetical protein